MSITLQPGDWYTRNVDTLDLLGLMASSQVFDVAFNGDVAFDGGSCSLEIIHSRGGTLLYDSAVSNDSRAIAGINDALGNANYRYPVSLQIPASGGFTANDTAYQAGDTLELNLYGQLAGDPLTLRVETIRIGQPVNVVNIDSGTTIINSDS